jgi:hypothetical protein
MTTARSSRPDDPRQTLARLAELAIVVPVEVGSRLIEAVPAVVDKVPSAAERVRREVVLARFLGKMAVDQGIRELKLRLATNEPSPPTDSASLPHGAREDMTEPVAATESGHSIGVPDAPDVTTLGLADYDHLSSAQIVGKLAGLDATERHEIERYERAGRHRRTILGKLEQLRAADT